MVRNVEVAKEVDEKREKKKVLEESLVEVKLELDAFAKEAKWEEDEEFEKGKEVAEEDVVPKPNPVLNEETFLKAIKALGGKYLEGVPLFSGKMDIDAGMDWIDNMENHLECDGVSEVQKFKVAKSRLRGLALTWWKYVQDERIRMGKTPIAN